MSSERAGVHTSSALNREKAEALLQEHNTDPQYRAELLDALEACVVSDPRIPAWTELDRALVAEACIAASESGGYDGDKKTALDRIAEQMLRAK